MFAPYHNITTQGIYLLNLFGLQWLIKLFQVYISIVYHLCILWYVYYQKFSFLLSLFILFRVFLNFFNFINLFNKLINKFNLFFKFIFQRGEGREKERERHISVWLPLSHPLLGTWSATQACILTGNRICDPLIHRLALNHLATPTKDFLGYFFLSFKKIFYLFYFQREENGGTKRGRETSVCGCLSHTPYWERDPQPRHVP